MASGWVQLRADVEHVAGTFLGGRVQHYCEVVLDRHDPDAMTAADVRAIAAHFIADEAEHQAKLRRIAAMTDAERTTADADALDAIFAHDSSDDRSTPLVRTPEEDARLAREHEYTARIMRERLEQSEFEDIFG